MPDYGQEKAYEELAGRFADGGAGPEGRGGDLAGVGVSEADGLAGAEGSGADGTDQAARAARRSVYEKLQQENPDFIGWIRIPGTRIDYPVVQSKDRPDYYLHRDFYGKESSFGTPYLAEDCTPGDPDRGLLLYGHHMKNGAMFAGLSGYTDQAFWEEHREIRFDTLEESGDYEVAAVVKLSASDVDLPWQQLVFPRTAEERQQAWQAFEKKRFYDTGIDLKEGDQILCLVTCEYTMEDGRLMVVARRRT